MERAWQLPRSGRLRTALSACSITAALVVTWSVPVAAATAHPSQTILLAISCAAPGDCTAVGAIGNDQPGFFTDPSIEPIYATESAGRWGAVHELHDPADSGTFTSVSCVASEDCTAVGYDYGGDYSSDGSPYFGYPIRAHEVAGKWSAVVQVKDAKGATFNSVSCTSTTSCTAVGDGPVAETETAGVWGPATSLSSPDLVGDLTSVSCPAAGNCTAVGGDEELGDGGEPPSLTDYLPIRASEIDGAWGSIAEVAGPMGSTFNSVSCVAAGCVAVGSLATGGSPFSAVESADIWDPVSSIALPGVGDLSDVSCWAAGECTGVGTVLRPSTTMDESVHVDMSAGTWEPATTAGGGDLLGVSCVSATDCGAVGDDGACPTATECASLDYAIYTGEVRGEWTEAPGPPKLRKVTALNHGLSISWTAPSTGRSTVTGYDAVAISTIGRAQFGYVCATTRSTSCTIKGLTNGRDYTIAVLARSPAGSSPLSATREAAPA